MKHEHKHDRRNFLGKLAGLGCASLSLAPMLSSITTLKAMNALSITNKPSFSTSNDYKALVCIMMSGGNDSFNMLVPKNNANVNGYDDYNTVRGGLALSESSLLDIMPLNDGDHDYDFGLHSSLANVKTMFDSENAAFISNVGTLVTKPTDSFNAYANSDYDKLPLGLMSHSDQRMHWQSSIPDQISATGWAGRLADLFGDASSDLSMNISLGGVNLFQQGNTLREFVVSGTQVSGINPHELGENSIINSLRNTAMDNMLNNLYANTLSKSYANINSKAIGGSAELSQAIDYVDNTILNSGDFPTAIFPDTSIGNQLKMVAKIIAAKNYLNISKQTFYVTLDGFDMHSGLIAGHSNLLKEFDDAIWAFYEAINWLGSNGHLSSAEVENIISFTISDFARKLLSNGNGTDHGWGSNVMVFGGNINGKKVFGNYPLMSGSPYEIYNGSDRTGVFVPTTSCDEYFADLAMWFDASPSDLYDILPNIGEFWTPSGTAGPLGLFV